MHVWGKSLAKGKAGEQAVQTYFEGLGYTCYSLPPKHQKRYGFDILARNSKETLYLEVKTEYFAEKSGNIFYETDVDGKLGWCLKYTANSKVTICWYFPHLKEIALYPAKNLKDIDYIKFPEKEVLNNWGRIVVAKGRVIPLTYIKQLSIVRSI